MKFFKSHTELKIRKINKATAISDILKLIPIVGCVVFIIIFLFSKDNITVESLLSFVPEEPLLAAFFIIFMFAAKSLSAVFPLIILEITVGIIYQPIVALIVNSVGITVSLLTGYFIGRFSGTGFLEKLKKQLGKFEKLKDISEKAENNWLFNTFFLRMLRFVPIDISSMYFGAMNMPLKPYLIGSFLGTLPGMISATLMGSSANDPSSPLFICSTIFTVLLTVISVIAYFIYSKKKDTTKHRI